MLYKGWLYIGPTVERERATWQQRLAEERERTKAAEDRLLAYAGTLKEATDATNRAVDLAERIVGRDASARSRANDR